MRTLFLILLFASFTAGAQDNWGAFSQRIDVRTLAGKKFRLESAVRAEPAADEPTAGASMWARVDLASGKVGFFQNGLDKPVRNSQWEHRVINGKIEKDAQWLNIGGVYRGRGRFWYDAFRLFIEKEKGVFEEYPLRDGSFEADSTHAAWGFRDELGGYKLGAVAGGYQSTRAFQVDGSGVKRAVVYGTNDSAGRYFSNGAVRIYYETYGQGEPLLLLHGNRQSIVAFKDQIPALAKQYHVIAVDTRGQGRSNEDGTRYTYDLFADDMKALLDHLKLDSVRVLGWSDGGNTGLIMAMKYPQKVKMLATMGANIFIDKTVVDKEVFREVAKMDKGLEGDTSYVARNNHRFNQLLLTEPRHSFEELRAIHCPVLVIAGEKDLIREAHTRGIAAGIPGATLYIAPKQTHYFPTESPKAFNELVLRFFSGASVEIR
ncbi:alpha/beta hydrolase [Flaviaesturariibacter flavus]|uniref:Alpha/beta hydrolase n=1 Tax=Flaviaesturariibacter flavus TaxID=2502780 RepID=A0A4R1BMP9_9BACT|nr:alpha/beta hydrolase [Flaviaesturariibacter flavus]TCJ18743.1 alpha/beta hydrolase [Flaviaesturariibacter flavus]